MAKQWTDSEIEAATKEVCGGGRVAGVAFFDRHPDIGFRIAVELQCEITEAVRIMEMVTTLLFPLRTEFTGATLVELNAWLARNRKEDA